MKDLEAGGGLDADEEARLWAVCASCDNAREKLILAYRPLVFWLARKFRVPYGTYSDLVQEGMIALICAVDNFDPGRNNRFVTYGYYRIRGRMINYLQRVEAKAPVPVEADDVIDTWAPVNGQEYMDWKIDLMDGINHLPSAEAQVVNSLVFEGRKAADVAAERGIDISHVYRIHRKAIKKLRDWLRKTAESATGDL